MFQPSTLSVSAACQTIAESAGASGDPEMTTRAHKSLSAAIKHFNSRYKWNWQWTEATPQNVYAPFGVTISASAGQLSATVGGGHGVQPDDLFSGSGFQAGNRISATAASSLGFSLAITGLAAGVQEVSATATRDLYDLPADFKAPFTNKLLVAQVPLWFINRRMLDRGSGHQEFTTSTPNGYDLFVQGSKGKIRLLQPPGQNDVMLLRYYRRMTVPSTSATASVLDIPQDYDDYLIAWAKWHFLVDKEDAQERAGTWLALANEGLTTMLKDQTVVPDENVGFTPGHYSLTYGPDDVRPWLGEP